MQSEKYHNIKVEEVIEKHWKTIEKNQENIRENFKKNQALEEELAALRLQSARLDEELVISQSRLDSSQLTIERELQRQERTIREI